MSSLWHALAALFLLPSARAMQACTEAVVLTRAKAPSSQTDEPPQAEAFAEAHAFPVISFNVIIGPRFNREVARCDGAEHANSAVDARTGFKKMIFCCDSDEVVAAGKTFNAVVFRYFNKPSLVRGSNVEEIGRMDFPLSATEDIFPPPRCGVERFPLYAESFDCVSPWDIIYQYKPFTAYPKRGQPGVRRPAGWYYYGVQANSIPAPVPEVPGESSGAVQLAEEEALTEAIGLDGEEEGVEEASPVEASPVDAGSEAGTNTTDDGRRRLRPGRGQSGHGGNCFKMTQRRDYGYATVMFRGPLPSSLRNSGRPLRWVPWSGQSAALMSFAVVSAAAAALAVRSRVRRGGSAVVVRLL